MQYAYRQEHEDTIFIKADFMFHIYDKHLYLYLKGMYTGLT